MNKKLIIAICFIVLCLIGVFLFLNCGRNIQKVTVHTSGGVPTVWSYQIEDKTIVDLKEVKRSGPGTAVDNEGGSINETYIFQGKKEGQTTITFEYKDVRDESKVEQTKVYKAIVDKRHNLKLKKIK